MKRIFADEMIKALPDSLGSEEMLEAVELWHDARFEIGKPLTPTAWKLQVRKLEAWGQERALAALLHSAASGYQGLFEPPCALPAASTPAKGCAASQPESTWEKKTQLDAIETELRTLKEQYSFDRSDVRERCADAWLRFQVLKKTKVRILREIARC
jgi:hypothetical protein